MKLCPVPQRHAACLRSDWTRPHTQRGHGPATFFESWPVETPTTDVVGDTATPPGSYKKVSGGGDGLCCETPPPCAWNRGAALHTLAPDGVHARRAAALGMCNLGANHSNQQQRDSKDCGNHSSFQKLQSVNCIARLDYRMLALRIGSHKPTAHLQLVLPENWLRALGMRDYATPPARIIATCQCILLCCSQIHRRIDGASALSGIRHGECHALIVIGERCLAVPGTFRLANAPRLGLGSSLARLVRRRTYQIGRWRLHHRSPPGQPLT